MNVERVIGDFEVVSQWEEAGGVFTLGAVCDLLSCKMSRFRSTLCPSSFASLALNYTILTVLHELSSGLHSVGYCVCRTKRGLMIFVNVRETRVREFAISHSNPPL